MYRVQGAQADELVLHIHEKQWFSKNTKEHNDTTVKTRNSPTCPYDAFAFANRTFLALGGAANVLSSFEGRPRFFAGFFTGLAAGSMYMGLSSPSAMSAM